MCESRYDGGNGDFYTSLVDASTGEIIVERIPTPKYEVVERAVVHNGTVYVFTKKGFKIFDMENLQFIKNVELIYSGDYNNHLFYDNKLILAMDAFHAAENPAEPHYDDDLYIYDLDDDAVVFSRNNMALSIAVLNNNIYLREGHYLTAYDLNSGQKKLNIKTTRLDLNFDMQTYTNESGEGFVIYSNTHSIQCIQEPNYQ